MIRSMTAFAAGERSTAWGRSLACEIRAVNHRFLELGVRAARGAAHDRAGRCASAWAALVSRGKVDVGFRFRPVRGRPRPTPA
jgi:uncharacterized protein YicC (UPF0701 family)